MELPGLVLAAPLLSSIPMRGLVLPRLTTLLWVVSLLVLVSGRLVLLGLAPLSGVTLLVLTAGLRLGPVGRGRLPALVEMVGLADRVALARPDPARPSGFVRLFGLTRLVGFVLLIGFAPSLVPFFVALRALGFHRLAAVLLTLLIRLHVLGAAVFRRRFLPLLIVVGDLVFRKELTGFRVTRRLAPALVLLGLRAVLVVFSLLVAAAADLVVLVRVVGAHKGPPAITCADSRNC